MNGTGTAPRRVFLSYRHEDEAHAAQVLELAARLREQGVDAWLDRYETTQPADWARLLLRRYREAELVLIVGSPGYVRSFELGPEPGGGGQGVAWEARLIVSDLYRGGVGARRIRPVLLPGFDRSCVPLPLATATLYELGRYGRPWSDADAGWARLLQECGATPGRPLPALPAGLPPGSWWDAMEVAHKTAFLLVDLLPDVERLVAFLARVVPRAAQSGGGSSIPIDRALSVVQALRDDEVRSVLDALGEGLPKGESPASIEVVREQWGYLAMDPAERAWAALLGAFPGGLPESAVPGNVRPTCGRWGQYARVGGSWVQVRTVPHLAPPAVGELRDVLAATRSGATPEIVETAVRAAALLGQLSDAWAIWEAAPLAGWLGSFERVLRVADNFLAATEPVRPRPELSATKERVLLSVVHTAALASGRWPLAWGALRSLWTAREGDDGAVAALWARASATAGDFEAARARLADARAEARSPDHRVWLDVLEVRLCHLAGFPPGSASHPWPKLDRLPARERVLATVWQHEASLAAGRSRPALAGVRAIAAGITPPDLYALVRLADAREAAAKGQVGACLQAAEHARALAFQSGHVPTALEVEVGLVSLSSRGLVGVVQQLPAWLRPYLTAFPWHAARLPPGW